MSDLKNALKDGAISGVGSFGATALTIGGIIIVAIAAIFYYTMQFCMALLSIHSHGDSRYEIEVSIRAVCDTYLYWYEKITSSIKNLVK